MIKRVIGLPGETVVIDTGTILIDGRADQDRWGVGLTSTDGEWTLAMDQIFVLSDNRSATRDDSRGFGPITAHTSRRVWWVVRIGGDRGSRPPLP
jgi:signal peptidase I